VETAIRDAEWPYDNGDDPSFHMARKSGRLTWGVCRKGLRNAIKLESVNSRNQPVGNVLNAALDHGVIDGRDIVAGDEDSHLSLAGGVGPPLRGPAVLRGVAFHEHRSPAHAADRAGIPVIARLKDNLPELSQSVERRFASRPPTRVYRDGKDRVEIWDADDFAPWETLCWDRVRVIRYRQHQPDQTIVEAQWLTNLPSRRVGSLSLYHLAKSRWEIENQGFHDAKNRYGLEHICHHHPNRILVGWLLLLMALVIERLYRIRYLHRGTRRILSADQLCHVLWLSPSKPCLDTG